MVPLAGLEPARPRSPDFESGVFTNFTTAAFFEKNESLQKNYLNFV
jgi:hypothetical protein